MNYSVGCAFTIHNMFMKFPYKKLHFNCDDSEKMIGDRHRDKVVKRIFRDLMNLILNDVVDNNATFTLPLTGKVHADIHMEHVEGDAFKNLRRAGKWRDVDFLASNFSGNRLAIYLYGNRTPRIKYIYTHKEIRDKITEYTNAGKLYC